MFTFFTQKLVENKIESLNKQIIGDSVWVWGVVCLLFVASQYVTLASQYVALTD